MEATSTTEAASTIWPDISGKVGVCIATSGPGATNLVTGIADAMIDSTPLVCITGQVPSNLLGSDAFQETDIIGISTPVTKWSYQITRVEEIPAIIAKAFYIARSGRPGPVLIDITKDAQFNEFDFSYEKCTHVRSYKPVPETDVSVIVLTLPLIEVPSGAAELTLGIITEYGRLYVPFAKDPPPIPEDR